MSETETTANCDNCEDPLTAETGCVRVGIFRYCADCAPEEDE